MKISVIIPAFNEEKHIGRALRSILDQSMNPNDYEVIVVDDNSSDRTSYALDCFGSAIKVYRNPSNQGLPASLNLGINNSIGRYIVRLDADDYVNKDYLLFLYTYIFLNKECHAVSCDYYVVDSQEKIISRENANSNPIGCAIMFDKEKLIEVGNYDDEFRYHEDKELRIRFEKKYEIHNLKVPLYRYRRHENNITNNIDEMDFHMNKLKNKHRI
jgi:glycosyltransferase involved in cell wall biosynthesis